jgi:hypothetical protein
MSVRLGFSATRERMVGFYQLGVDPKGTTSVSKLWRSLGFFLREQTAQE